MDNQNLKYALLVLLIIVAVSSRFINITTQGILVDETWVVPNTFLHFGTDSIFPKLFTYPQFLSLSTEKQEILRKIYNLHPIFQIIAYQATDVHPPLFHILNFYWSQCFGYGLLSIRLPASFYFLLTSLFLYQILLRQQVGFWPAFVATCLLILTPCMLFFSNFARPYTLLVLLSLISSYSCYKLVIGRFEKRKWFLIYVLSAVGAVYTHYYAVLLVMSQAGYLVFESMVGGYQRKLPAIVLVFLIIGFLFLPQALIMIIQMTYRYPMTEHVFQHFGLKSIFDLFLYFGMAYSRSTIYWLPNLIVSGLQLFLFSIGIIYLLQKRNEPYARFWLFFFFVPFTLIIAANLVKPVFNPRNCLIIIIPYLTITAFGISYLKNKFLKTSSIAILAITGLFFIYGGLHAGNIRGAGAVEDWKSTAAYINGFESHMPVYVSPKSYLDALYYYIPDNHRLKPVSERLKDERGKSILVLVVPHNEKPEEILNKLLTETNSLKSFSKLLTQFGRIFIYEIYSDKNQ